MNETRPPHRGVIVVPLVRTLLLAAPVVIASGCYGPVSRERFVDLEAPPERLRVIQTMDIEPMSAPSQEVDLDAISEVEEAGETLDMKLEDCRAAALANNLDLRVSLFAPSIAATAVTEEEARFEAVFTASAAYSSSERQTSSSLTSSQADFTDASIGLSVPLRTGGTVSVDFPFSRTDSDLAFNTLNPAYESELNFSLTHQLLRGAGLRANTFGIRIARYQAQETEAQTKLEVMRVIAEVDRLYWLLYAAREQLGVEQLQYELAIAQLERARRLVRAENAPEVEIIRAESGVADRVEAIIVAQNRVRTRQRDLKRLMNRPDLPMDGRTLLLNATEPNPVALDLDEQALVEAAMDQRMELLQIELQIAQDASTVDFRKNQKLPLLALEYRYGLNAVDDSFGDTVDTIRRADFDSWRIGLRGEMPIGNEQAESQYHRAILQRLQRLATKRQREEVIRQEVLDAVDSLRANWQRVLAARQRVALAARTLEAEQRQFDLGLRTSTDVLDAQTRLADAQTSEIVALTTYQVSQTDLAFATGTILGHAQVRWTPREVEAQTGGAEFIR
jgi:outer membrane protein